MRKPGNYQQIHEENFSAASDMKHSVTSSEVQTRAPWSLPVTLAYFPQRRVRVSDRDLGAGVAPGTAASQYGLPDLGRYHGG